MPDTTSPLRPMHEPVGARRRGPSIQIRLLALVMIATLPALLFSVVQAREASRMERRNAEQRTLQLARRIASRVDDHVGTVDVLLTSLSYTVHRELAEALAARRPGLRVLYASGYPDDVLLDQGVLAEGMSLLDKPFTPGVLATRVAAMLEMPAIPVSA